jgi:hypothetical protein
VHTLRYVGLMGAAVAAALTVAAGAATSPTAVGASVTADQANDGLPSRWFGTLESFVVIPYFETTSTTKTFARVTFALSGVRRTRYRKTSYAEYSYRPTGTLQASYLAEGGGCRWRGQGTVRLTPAHGLLRVTVVRAPGKPVYVEYGTLSPGSYGAKDPTIPVTLTCPTHGPNTSPYGIHWLGIPLSSKTKATARRLHGTYTYTGRADGFRRWCLTRKPADLRDCPEELEAVAKVSGSRLRAATRTLDGSDSTGDIQSYRWTFSPAPCSGGPSACAGACEAARPKSNAEKRGEHVTIKPLCSVIAKLTVSDGRDEDSDTVEVTVNPRSDGWRTTVHHRSVKTPVSGAPSGAPIGPPSASCTPAPANDCRIDLAAGLNVPDPDGCAGEEFRGSRIFCPLLGTRRTWNGRGYTLARVSDPGGPFDGYFYVKNAVLTVKRLAYINPDLLPGSTFYNHNKASGAPIDEFVAAVEGHEGWGDSSKPETGHSQIMRALVTDPDGRNDPRREIERLFAATAADVQSDADRKIKEIDTFIDEKADDPLALLWQGTLYFYDAGNRRWIFGPFQVPYPSR